jgi:hypothetical protein
MPSKKTKKQSDLESQVKSLEKEIKSLNSSTKVLARDVDAVTKTLKNSKKIAKAAKSANEKVSDKDVERISESIAREKQLVKLANKLTGTLKQSDVNKITKALTFGKELGKLARSISSRITAREVNALNKALINAKEVKRISNSLADKISKVDIKVLTGAAKYKKDSVANQKANKLVGASSGVLASDDASNTLNNILNSVSVLPKIAEDVSKIISERKVDARQKIIKRSEDLETLREGESKRAVATKSGTVAGSGTSTAFNLLSGAAGLSASAVAALVAALVVSPEFRKILTNAITDAGTKYAEEKAEDVKSGFDRFIENLMAGDFNLVAKQIKDVASPAVAGLATLAKALSSPTSAGQNLASKASLLTRLRNYLSPIANANRLLKFAGFFAAPLNIAAGVADAVQGASSDAYLKYGTGRSTAGLATGMAGQEDEPKFWRVLSKMGLGATVGGLRGGPVGAFAGMTSAGLAAYYGPEKTAEVIDSALQYANNIKTDIINDFSTGFGVAIADPIERMAYSIKQWYYEKELRNEYNRRDMMVGDSFAGNLIASMSGADSGDIEDIEKARDEVRRRYLNEIYDAKTKKNSVLNRRIDITRKRGEDQNKRWSQSLSSWREETYGRKPIDTTAGYMSDYLRQLFKAESGNNPTKKNPLSSASGLGQFIKPTWESVTEQMGKNWTLSDRFDPKKATEASIFLTNQNREAFKSTFNREPSYAELYSLWFLGTPKGINFLQMKDAAPYSIAKNLFPDEARSNPDIFLPGMSLKGVFDILSNKIQPGGTRKYLPDMTELPIKSSQLETNSNNTVVNIINSFNQNKTDNSTRMNPLQQFPSESSMSFGSGSPVDRGRKF